MDWGETSQTNQMEVRAVAKYNKVQPRKVRRIAETVKGQPAQRSAAQLLFHASKSAAMLRKVILSAIANAVENHNTSPETLRISTIMVDEGPRQKRVTQKAMGRGARILKKTSHITVVVEDSVTTGKQKPHGTKAKPRPKFDAPRRSRGGAQAAVPKTEAQERPVAEPLAAVEPVEEPQDVSAVEPETSTTPTDATTEQGPPEAPGVEPPTDTPTSEETTETDVKGNG